MLPSAVCLLKSAKGETRLLCLKAHHWQLYHCPFSSRQRYKALICVRKLVCIHEKPRILARDNDNSVEHIDIDSSDR